MSDFLADLKGAYNKVDSTVSEAKKSFGRALVDATDLTPGDMRSQQWAKDSKRDLQEYAAEASDMILPGTSDAIPFGRIIKGGKTAAKIIDNMKVLEKANLPELTRKGANLLGKPVLNAGEKVVSFGKTIVKESQPINVGKVLVKPW